MDYLQTVVQLDHARIAVIGHSRLALTALWCAAMDERFSLAVAGNSGSLYRGSQAESFRDLSVNIHVTGFARICFVMIVMQMICHLICIF